MTDQDMLFMLFLVAAFFIYILWIIKWNSNEYDRWKTNKDKRMEYVQSLQIGHNITNDQTFKEYFTLTHSKRSENANWNLYKSCGMLCELESHTIYTTPLGIITEITW